MSQPSDQTNALPHSSEQQHQQQQPSPSTPAQPDNADRKARKDAKRAAKEKSLQSKAAAAATAAASQPPPHDRPTKKPHRNDPRSQPAEVQLSKALAYILRHGALKEGLAIRPDGFIKLDDVLARPRLKSLNLAQQNDGAKPRRPAFEDVQRVVEDNEKKRFELHRDDDDGAWYIRAVQGHSLKEVNALPLVQLCRENLYLLRPGVPFPNTQVDAAAAADDVEPRMAAVALNGDKDNAPAPILVIHGTNPEAWERIRESGGLKPMTRNHIHLAKSRTGVISGMRKSATRMVYIDIGAALEDGIPFFLSSNDVVLTPGRVAPGTSAEDVIPSAEEALEGSGAGTTGGGGGGDGGSGVLPLRYVVRVEDAKGEVVWSPP